LTVAADAHWRWSSLFLQQRSKSDFQLDRCVGVRGRRVHAQRHANPDANTTPPWQRPAFRQNGVQTVDGDRHDGHPEFARQQANSCFERL
jgi:hypothetical protein